MKLNIFLLVFILLTVVIEVKAGYQVKDNTVIDIEKGLQWQLFDNGSAQRWEEAKEFCLKLEFAGEKNWRLPNVLELGQAPWNKAIIKKETFHRYWSSDIWKTCDCAAMTFSTTKGEIKEVQKSVKNNVRCVRDL